MSEENFSRDYRRAFATAVEENNLALMKRLFEQLADEVGIPNPSGDSAAAQAGKAAAEKLNAIARGDGPGKKI